MIAGEQKTYQGYMNKIDEKIHTPRGNHICCYSDFYNNRSAIIEGFIVNRNLVISYFNDQLTTNISELTNEIASRKKASYYINLNESLYLALGGERTTIAVPFDPSNKGLLKTYEATYKSLVADKRIKLNGNVIMSGSNAEKSVITILLYSFSEKLFSTQVVRQYHIGGKIDNPFKDNYYYNNDRINENQVTKMSKLKIIKPVDEVSQPTRNMGNLAHRKYYIYVSQGNYYLMAKTNGTTLNIAGLGSGKVAAEHLNELNLDDLYEETKLELSQHIEYLVKNNIVNGGI